VSVDASGKETDDKKTMSGESSLLLLLLGPKMERERKKKNVSNSTRKRPVAKTRAAQQPRVRTPRYPFEPSVPIPRAFRPRVRFTKEHRHARNQPHFF
jgi:hypothetical protein